MICDLLKAREQETKTGNSFFHRFKWGIVFAGTYLNVAIPCAAIYLGDRHEYSIPALIVIFSSYPVYFILFWVLRPLTLPLERLAHGETLILAILLLSTALFYFGAGQSVGWLFRRAARRARPRREAMEQ